MIPVRLFDSLAHPTCNGKWFGNRSGVTHEEVALDLARHGYSGALAVGLPGVGDYEHTKFMAITKQHADLIPVAALTRYESRDLIARDLDEIVGLGFRIVKIHPRLLNYEKTLEMLPVMIHECVNRHLAVMLCTYPEYISAVKPSEALQNMAEAIRTEPAGYFMTMHSGVLDPMPFAEIARNNDRVILDFSLSLLKYPYPVRGFLKVFAKEIPQSICLGSDGPEWTYDQVGTELELISAQSGLGVAGRLGGQNAWDWVQSLSNW